MAKQDGVDELVRAAYLQQTLEAYATAKADVDLSARTQELLTIGRRLFADTSDVVYHAQLQQRIAIALHASAELQHRQGNAAKTNEYALAALKLLKEALKEREQTPAHDHLVGKLLFLVGSSHAIHKKNHQEAIRWFDQAKIYLKNGPPAMSAWETADHGDRLVSMGVSYWQVKKKQAAAELTLAGIQQLEAAVESGNAEQGVLAIPYANYASMQESLGDKNAARTYTAKAQRINAQQGNTQRR